MRMWQHFKAYHMILRYHEYTGHAGIEKTTAAPYHSPMAFEDFVEIMARLREGCPWDKKQTRESLRPYLVEEAYELLEALDTGDDDDAIYIDNWRIECDRLYHKHPNDWGYGLTGTEGMQEYDVNDRVCWKCEVRCPNEIWFAHRLQQLP